MKNKNKVLVVGSVALDDVETPFGRREISLGGSSVYFSTACSLFSPVSMVGVVGEDFPQEYIEDLQGRGVDTRSLKRVPGKTFHWKGRYDFDLNTAHTLDTQLNVFAEFDPDLTSDQKEIPYLFLANIDPELQLKVASEMKTPRIIAMDTMNFWIDGKKNDLLRVIKIVDYLIINDAEVRQLTKEGNLIKAASEILSWGPRLIIVKQGEYGVTMFYKDTGMGKVSIFSAPAIPLEAVLDPTGAGDSFAGGFMGYLASSSSENISEKVLRCAVAMGSVIASFTVEDFSLDKLRSISQKDISRRYSRLKEISHFDELE